jgi:SAM-dependent methyltransferase
MHIDSLQRVNLFCTSCATFDCRIIQHKLVLIPEVTQAEFVIFGRLECPNCGQQYPIIDGVPSMVQSSPNNPELAKQYLDAHYGTKNTTYWKEMNLSTGTGLCLDVGCSVGRYTFECSRSGFAVGIDVNFNQLKLAAEFQRTGQITFSRKRRPLLSENKKSSFIPSNNVLFLQADIHNPPFEMDSFDFISGLNLLDSVRYPLVALGQMDAMLKPGGTLFLSSPYTWSSDVGTEWLETEDVEPHRFVKELLTGERLPECHFDYRIITEKANIPWRLRKQDTLEFVYLVDTLTAEKSWKKEKIWSDSGYLA